MKTLMIAIMLTAMATAGFAQTKDKSMKMDHEKAAKMRTEKMLEQGLINEDQKEAVYAIHVDDAKKRMALREEQRATMAPFKEEHKAIRSETDDRLSDVLSAEQMKNLQEHRKAKQKEKKDFRKHSNEGPHKLHNGHQKGAQEGIRMNENE